jgi:hypothetical protein
VPKLLRSELVEAPTTAAARQALGRVAAYEPAGTAAA